MQNLKQTKANLVAVILETAFLILQPGDVSQQSCQIVMCSYTSAVTVQVKQLLKPLKKVRMYIELHISAFKVQVSFSFFAGEEK